MPEFSRLLARSDVSLPRESLAAIEVKRTLRGRARLVDVNAKLLAVGMSARTVEKL
jgi:hypothetical protein